MHVAFQAFAHLKFCGCDVLILPSSVVRSVYLFFHHKTVGKALKHRFWKFLRFWLCCDFPLKSLLQKPTVRKNNKNMKHKRNEFFTQLCVICSESNFKLTSEMLVMASFWVNKGIPNHKVPAKGNTSKVETSHPTCLRVHSKAVRKNLDKGETEKRREKMFAMSGDAENLLEIYKFNPKQRCCSNTYASDVFSKLHFVAF